MKTKKKEEGKPLDLTLPILANLNANIYGNGNNPFTKFNNYNPPAISVPYLGSVQGGYSRYGRYGRRGGGYGVGLPSATNYSVQFADNTVGKQLYDSGISSGLVQSGLDLLSEEGGETVSGAASSLSTVGMVTELLGGLGTALGGNAETRRMYTESNDMTDTKYTDYDFGEYSNKFSTSNTSALDKIDESGIGNIPIVGGAAKYVGGMADFLRDKTSLGKAQAMGEKHKFGFLGALFDKKGIDRRFEEWEKKNKRQEYTAAATRDVDIDNQHKVNNYFADGGDINIPSLPKSIETNPAPTAAFTKDSSILDVKVGGLHETNPKGGVFIGMGDNKKPNLVEEGEVVWKDKVFTNRF